MLASLISAAVVGCVSAFAVTAAGFTQARFPALGAPVWILGVAALAMVIEGFGGRFAGRALGDGENYGGISELLMQVHEPSGPGRPLRWLARGLLSFMLSVCGGVAGSEGAAIELSQAWVTRTRRATSRWFEERRRTDASLVAAAGISAAFGAPFAGTVLASEMGLAGRAVPTVFAALVAFVCSRTWQSELGLLATPGFGLSAPLYGFSFGSLQIWGCALAIGLLCAPLGLASVRYLRYAQDSLLDLFQTRAWMRILSGGGLLFLLLLAYHPASATPGDLLGRILWGKVGGELSGLLFFARLLALSALVGGFGSAGIFGPVFILGALVGAGMSQWMYPEVPGFAAVCGLAGGAAFWGAVLGVPVAGAILAFELTQNPTVLLPCLVAGGLAFGLRRALGFRSLLEVDLHARGLTLSGGRSEAVLESLLVRDAMVSDHEVASDQDPLNEVRARLMRSAYPFVPVVNAQGKYLGLLSIDILGGGGREPRGPDDLAAWLRRRESRVPTVRAGDSLARVSGVFRGFACAPVVTEDGRLSGLLFSSHVRLAYDRAVARKAVTSS